MAERAAGYVEEEFAAVKTHLGNGRGADEERVEAILAAIGDAELMVDMNCGYERHDALRVGKMLEGHDVYWYEEPLSPYDVDGYAWLHRKLDVPIATGENEYTAGGSNACSRRRPSTSPCRTSCGAVASPRRRRSARSPGRSV